MHMLRSLGVLSILATAAAGAGPERHIDGSGDPLPAGAVARLGSSRFRQLSPATCVAFSPDNKFLAVGSADGVVRLWNVTTGLEARKCKGHTGGVTAVRFTPNGRFIVSASHDGSLRLWDVSTGNEERSFLGHQSVVLCLAVSSDGKTLYSGGSDRVVRIWEVDSGKETRQIGGHKLQITGMDLSPDDKKLLTASSDGTLRLWDAANGTESLGIDVAKTGPVSKPIFAANGKLVFGPTSFEGGLRSWDATTGKETHQYPASAAVRTFAVAPDAKSAVIAEPERYPSVGVNLRILNLASGEEVRSVPVSASLVNALTYSPNGKLIAAACSDSFLRVLDAGTGKLTHGESGHAGTITDLEYTPDGKHVISIDADRSLRAWSLESGKEVASFNALGIGPSGLAMVPDTGEVVCTSGERAVLTADLAGLLRGDVQALRKREFPETTGVTATAAAGNGKLFAVATANGVIRLRHCVTGDEQGVLSPQPTTPRGPVASASTLAFSADSRFLAARCSDGTARIWDVEKTKEIRRLAGMELPGPVMFSADGCSLLTADQMLRLWERISGQVRWQVELTRLGGVRCLTFSPDRSLFALGHADGTISVRSVISGAELIVLATEQGAVQVLRFSPDGQHLASGGADSTILVWDVSEQAKAARRTEMKLEAADLQSLWKDLGASDAGKAYLAMDRLAAGSDAVVAFFKDNVKPPPPADEKTIAKLIEQLDADDVETRDQATSSLQDIGEAVVAPLQKVLEASPSLEVRTRAQKILENQKTGTAAASLLRGLRAIEVLEWIGSRDAVQLLETYTKEGKSSVLAVEAKYALGRVKKK
jgi:WD40 repeat protein